MNGISYETATPNQGLKRTRRTASPCFAGVLPAHRLAPSRWASL